MLAVLKLCSGVLREPLDHLELVSSSPLPILTWRWRKYIRYLFSKTLPDSQFLYLFYCPTLDWTELAYTVSNGEKGREWHFTRKNCFEQVSKLSIKRHCHHSSCRSWTLDFTSSFRLWLSWKLQFMALLGVTNMGMCLFLGFMPLPFRKNSFGALQGYLFSFSFEKGQFFPPSLPLSSPFSQGKKRQWQYHDEVLGWASSNELLK